MKIIVIVFVALFSACICLAVSIPNPLHASCNIDWSFGLSCKDVGDKIVNQIKSWKGDDCGSGEKCNYSFDSFDGETLKAKHTTPVHEYVDDLTMTFKANGSGCSVKAHSSSELWYAVLDYGTNYCNLRNLINGSGLDKSPGFQEKTGDDVCTQFTSANCEKY